LSRRRGGFPTWRLDSAALKRSKTPVQRASNRLAEATGPGLAAAPPPGMSVREEAGTTAPRTKEHQVAELLRERIIAGSFFRGQRLKQAEIAKQLAISITPVREALRLLEAEGYVRVSSHRGAVVAPFQIDQADELYDLRLSLEGKLAAAAAKLLTPADLDTLLRLDAGIRKATAEGDREGMRGGNFRFHFCLYDLAALPNTVGFVRVLWARYPFDLLGAIPGRPELVIAEHAAILEALRRRDPRQAARAMQAHIASGHRQFKATYVVETGR
jgi:DNA-binding GntR family transcriptional regulator